eukprot:768272-Hanusia_phi.AAC.8
MQIRIAAMQEEIEEFEKEEEKIEEACVISLDCMTPSSEHRASFSQQTEEQYHEGCLKCCLLLLRTSLMIFMAP